MKLGPMKTIFPVLCIILASIFSPSASGTPHKTVTGRVVAYTRPLACLNGNGDWSLVLRAERARDVRPQFVRLDFSLPCDKSPEWISSKPSLQKFRLIRKKDCDSTLSGSVDRESPENPVLPIWEYPPGAEHERLPFGQVSALLPISGPASDSCCLNVPGNLPLSPTEARLSLR